MRRCGNLHPFLEQPATPLLTPDAIAELKHAGLSRLILTLDAASAELHDLICGVHGSFARTMEAIQWADHWKLPFQITTHFCERNLHELENLAALLRPSGSSNGASLFLYPQRPQSWKRRLPLGNLKARLRGSTRCQKLSRSRSRPLKLRTIADMFCNSKPGKGPACRRIGNRRREFPALCP